jgi:hypothetical protein
LKVSSGLILGIDTPGLREIEGDLGRLREIEGDGGGWRGTGFFKSKTVDYSRHKGLDQHCLVDMFD